MTTIERKAVDQSGFFKIEHCIARLKNLQGNLSQAASATKPVDAIKGLPAPADSQVKVTRAS